MLGTETDDEDSDEGNGTQDAETPVVATDEMPVLEPSKDNVFKMPSHPPAGAKSKAKLSSNDGFSSTESLQGITMHPTNCERMTQCHRNFCPHSAAAVLAVIQGSSF